MRNFLYLSLALIVITGFSPAATEKQSTASGRKRVQVGRSYGKKRSFNVDDHGAEPHAYPFLVSIQNHDHDSANWTHQCVGTIISKRTILTSEHCVHACKDNHCQIVTGAHDLRNTIERSQSTYTTKCSEVHPKYNNITFNRDYAVIYTSEPIVYVRGVVEKLEVPKTSSDISTHNCISPAWGYEWPATLQYLSVKMYPREICQELHDFWFQDEMICGYHSDNKNQWWDFGAPLLCDGTLAGISSWAYPPWGSSTYPAVFSEVAKALDWIKSKVKGSCPSSSNS